jgi:hypothetical protein
VRVGVPSHSNLVQGLVNVDASRELNLAKGALRKPVQASVDADVYLARNRGPPRKLPQGLVSVDASRELNLAKGGAPRKPM